MSPAEIVLRVWRIISVYREKVAGTLGLQGVPEPNACHPVRFLDIDRAPSEDGIVLAADRILNGELRVFSMGWTGTGSPPDWNRDPLTGISAPRSFGKTLNYRDPSLVGDIKYLWEPNRHLHLVTLAQAYRQTGDRRYLDATGLHLSSWLTQCPYPLGPNWTSSLELGIRLINWSFVWQLIGGSDSPLFSDKAGQHLREQWLASIFQHARFIQGYFSRYSSANNHLIGELAGLVVASSTWPFWDQLETWGIRAQKMLDREALKQNAPDGVNREQAISYQQFVLDFLVIAGLAVKCRGRDFSPEYWGRIESMMEYIASIMDTGGNIPMIGDADDGFVVRLTEEPNWCPYRSLLATGTILFNRSDFKWKAGELDNKTRWLLGGNADSLFDAIDAKSTNLPVHRAFADGGYYLLGDRFETDDEVKLVVDAGPIGYPSIAAHGHADALAFTLSHKGREILVDPGTFAYHTNKKWRDYFRGTSAHNTVRVDGVDQSVSGGNFMWLRKASPRCEERYASPEEDRFTGSHDGYTRLDDPVVHRREIVLTKAERTIRVTDCLICKGDHRVEIFWHFAEVCKVDRAANGLSIARGNSALRMEFSGPKPEVEIFNGDDIHPAGWISRQYDIKVPAYTAVLSGSIAGDAVFETVIRY